MKYSVEDVFEKSLKIKMGRDSILIINSLNEILGTEKMSFFYVGGGKPTKKKALIALKEIWLRTEKEKNEKYRRELLQEKCQAEDDGSL